MKKFFTQTKFILAVLFGMGLFTSQAQLVSVDIEGLGSFEATLGAFGSDPCDFNAVEAPVRLINDGTSTYLGCEAYNDPDLNGKIAVVNRGECAFEAKAINAQDNGALALIICNNEPGFRPMAGVNGQSSIPTVMISQEDCFEIIASLEGGVEINSTLNAELPTLPDDIEVIWGDQPGQGQFDGGLNGWTVGDCMTDFNNEEFNDVQWEWYENPIEQVFGGQIESYSRCNGAIGYDATGWNLDQFDANPGAANPLHNCEITSPVIDLSDAEFVTLQFWQLLFTLNGQGRGGQTSVAVFSYSLDGGMTFENPIDIETSNVLTADETSLTMGEIRRLFLPELGGESQVVLKFQFWGDFYAWYIDDVYLVKTPPSSLSLDEEVYGLPSSARTPQSLALDPTIGITQVANTGSATQTNVQVNIEYDGPVTGTATIDLGNVPADTVVFDCTSDGFIPSEVGIYTGSMSVTSDSVDFDLSDNSTSFQFEITDSIWAKDLGVEGPALTPTNFTSWVMGAVYSVPDSYTGSDSIYAAEFGFSLFDEVDDSYFLSYSLIEWNDNDNNGLVEEDERVNLGIGNFVSFSYRDGVDNTLQRYEFVNPQTNEATPLALEAGKTYIFSVNFTSQEGEVLGLFHTSGLNYAGTDFVYDNNPDCANFSRYRNVFAGGEDRNGTWETNWAGGTTVPIVRLFTKPVATVSNDEITQDYSFNLYPNPAQSVVNFDLEFENRVENLELSITDISGKIMDVRQLDRVQQTQVQVNVDNYPTGVYFAKIQTDEGIATQRFVVGK